MMENVKEYGMHGVAIITLVVLLILGGLLLFKKLPNVADQVEAVEDRIVANENRAREERANLLGNMEEVLDNSNTIRQQNDTLLARQNSLIANQNTVLNNQRNVLANQRTIISDTNTVRALIGSPANGSTTLFGSVAALSNDVAAMRTLLNSMDGKLDQIIDILVTEFGL